MQYEYISFIAAEVEQIWPYFAKQQLFAQFQIAPLNSFDFQEGKGFSLGTSEIHILNAKFKKINVNKLIEIELNYAETNSTVVVKIIFYPLGKMSSLSIIIDDIKDNDPVIDVSKNHWPGSISQLKTLIETGKGLPWPN
ncbi:SRPBCC domain-containing protein [Lentisphaera profundi]|uniref:SRPBCC domain-containing protein n=1 Tax=Lentisphaera profundi TaxID=1658616 RepID=A0ABY7VY45_9BACT|nr:SRPBCC domain-containing protein [Lentisphaera profundi]WDE96988.1 SRPBCC domain-containing protein [Lentisphaera profundi]